MIKLYQFEPAFGLPNASPFCMKLETYLRMAGLPFEVPAASMDDLRKAPKGKLPYIEEQGQTLSDSSFIIDALKARHGDTLDAWLSAEQRAEALAFQRLIEENFYWVMVHARWIDAQGWEKTRPAFFGKLPVPLKWIVPPLARRGIRAELRGQGMGRHSEAEILAIGRRDITALADFLGDKPYFMGHAPCTLDASAYAFLANLIWAPVGAALQEHARQYPQLQAYCQRMRERFYA